MKKTTITILIIIAILSGNIYLKTIGASIPKVTTKVDQKNLDEYQKQLDREKELKDLQLPTIIQNNIRKVDKRTSLEGSYRYYSKITDKGIFDLTLREMTLDFTFSFGIGISSEYIKINKVEEKIVYVSIPKNRIQLQYIQFNQDSRIIDGKKRIFISQFNPSDVATLIKQSQQNVANKIGNDKELFNQAYANLQEEIEFKIILMGFDKVIFTEDLV